MAIALLAPCLPATGKTRRIDLVAALKQLQASKPTVGKMSALFKQRAFHRSDTMKEVLAQLAAAGVLKLRRDDIYQKDIAGTMMHRQWFEANAKVICSSCQGYAKTAAVCPTCKGMRRCGNRRCVGGYIVSQAIQGMSRGQICPICKGTGACPKCRGVGALVGSCSKCNGKRAVWSREKINNLYRLALHAAIAEAMKPQIMRSVVVIKGDKGVGTGFLCRFRGHPVVVSNAHVYLGNRSVKLHTVQDGEVYYEKVLMAKDRDVAIYRILNPDRYKFLDVSTNVGKVAIGDFVSVYGNSGGGGVVTSLMGTVLGIGPELIEVSAAFVRGNSGSPIVIDGKVVGIATLVTRQQGDWVNAGTRFQGVRRFGVRFDNTELATYHELDMRRYAGDIVLLEKAKEVVDEVIAKLETRRFYLPDRKESAAMAEQRAALRQRQTWSCHAAAEEAKTYIGYIDQIAAFKKAKGR